MEKIIINHSHTKNFTIIPNEILQATDIPFFTKGVLCYLLSLPSNWRVSVSHLASHFSESEYKMTRALKDLITLGYCQRIEGHGEHGRFTGQVYKITDIRWDFTEPSVFKSDGDAPENEPSSTECPKSTDPVIFTDSAKSTDTVKNGVSIKNIDNKDIYINNKKNREAQSTDEPLCLFVNSRFYDFDRFCSKFAGDDYAGVNLRHYYEAVKNWSASKRVKRNDWIATARGFMHRDNNEGKLARVTGFPGNMEEWQYKAILRDRELDDDSLWAQ